MASGLNKVLLIGNTAAEPDFRILNNNGSNTSIATVGLATNESHKDSAGNTTEQTEWHRLVFWGRTAEIVRDFVHKGSLIFVEGKIKTRSYEDQQGVKRYSTEIHVSEMKLLGGKSSSSPAQGNDQWGQQQQAPAQWGQAPAQAPGWAQQQPQAAPQQWGQQPAQPQQQYQQPYQQPQQAPAYQGYQQAPAYQGYQQAPQPAFRSAPPAGAIPVGPAQPAPQQPAAPQPAPQPQPSPAAFQAPQAQAPAAPDGSRPFKDDDLPF